MRASFLFWFLLCCTVGMVPLAACGGDDATARLPPRADDDSTGDDDDDIVSPGKDSSAVDSNVPLEDAGPTPGRVFAHTTNTLYLFEPLSRSLTVVGRFSCLNGAEAMIDLAIDRSGAMFGTTFRRFLSIDPITASCTQIAVAGTGTMDYPNSLSFVPAGTVDPGKEALVGYATAVGDSKAVNYVRIDVTTGAMTSIGNINALATGTQYRASGDIVSIIQDANRTYATVKLQPTAGNDLLAEVNPVNGNIKRIIGDTGQLNLFGFGYWAGKGYGFSDTGKIIEINMTTGTSTVVKTLDDAGAAIPWYGAGVTTQAPVR